VVTAQGRLTLTSGVPVTTADVAGVGTIYYTPSTGGLVPLWDGTQFVPTSIGVELSNVLANSAVGKAGPAAVAGDSSYYLMVWNDGGTVRLTRSPAWVSVTSPGTGTGSAETEAVAGFQVNKHDITNGPAARRGTIIGGFASTALAQAIDSAQFRYLSDLYNAVPRLLRVLEMTPTWNYSTGVWRVANGSANTVGWFHAAGGRLVVLDATGHTSSDIVSIQAPLTGIGIDSTVTTTGVISEFNVLPVAARMMSSRAKFQGYVGIGLHLAHWLEQFAHLGAGGVATWYGTGSGLTPFQSGMVGWTEN
jgi:hypothetical protein